MLQFERIVKDLIEIRDKVVDLLINVIKIFNRLLSQNFLLRNRAIGTL